MAGLTKVKGSGLATGAATDSLVGIADSATSTAITIDSSENIQLTGSSNVCVLSMDTGSGSDTKQLSLAGGGADSDGRGARFRLYGNNHSTSVGEVDLSTGNVAGSLFYIRAKGEVRTFTNGSERMRIDASGNVGIGTSSPSAKLSITDNTIGDLIKVTGANGTDLRIGNHALANGGIYINSQAASDDLRLQTQGSTRMTIDSSGNVGIGTSSPETNLHIEDSSSFSIIRLVSSTTQNAGIDFGDPDDRDIGRVRYNNSDNSMVFHTNAAERMRIDSSGQLIMGGSGGVALYYNRINLVGNTSYTFDITVPDEGSTGATYLVECGYSHYFGAFYNTHLHGWYSARGTTISAMGVLLDQNSSYAGAWSVSKPTATTLRLTKSAGSGGGSGRGFIKVTWAK